MTEDVKDEKSLKEKVDMLTTRNFSITRCPEIVWEDFVNFCKRESGDSYSMGIKLLLDSYKTNAKELMLYQRILDIEARMSMLEN